MDEMIMPFHRTVFLPKGSPGISVINEIQADVRAQEITSDNGKIYCRGELDILIDYISQEAEEEKNRQGIFSGDESQIPESVAWQALLTLPFCITKKGSIPYAQLCNLHINTLDWQMVAPRALEMHLDILILKPGQEAPWVEKDGLGTMPWQKDSMYPNREEEWDINSPENESLFAEDGNKAFKDEERYETMTKKTTRRSNIAKNAAGYRAENKSTSSESSMPNEMSCENEKTAAWEEVNLCQEKTKTSSYEKSSKICVEEEYVCPEGSGNWEEISGCLEVPEVECKQKAAEKGMEKAAEKGMEKAAEKGMEKAAEKGMEKAAEKGMEKAAEKGMEKAAEKGMEKAAEKGMEKAAEKGIEKAAEEENESGNELAAEEENKISNELAAEEENKLSNEMANEEENELGEENMLENLENINKAIENRKAQEKASENVKGIKKEINKAGKQQAASEKELRLAPNRTQSASDERQRGLEEKRLGELERQRGLEEKRLGELERQRGLAEKRRGEEERQRGLEEQRLGRAVPTSSQIPSGINKEAAMQKENAAANNKGSSMSFYRVQQGEDLISIALKVGVSPQKLAERNKIGMDDVKAGMLLIIPR